MKKLIILAIVFIIPLSAIAGSGGIIPQGKKVLGVSASSYSDSMVIPLKYNAGHAVIQLSVAGSGTLTMTTIQSVDGTTYVETQERVSAGDVLTGITSASGTVITRLEPIATKYLKVRFGESAGSAYTVTYQIATESE